MWKVISKVILRYRAIIIVLLLGLTGLMVYKARTVGLDYSFAKLLPDDDPTNIEHVAFKEEFGQDGSVMVIGVKDSMMFKDTSHFNNWFRMSEKIARITVPSINEKGEEIQISAIDSVFSTAHLYDIRKNKETKSFTFEPLLAELPKSNVELDSVRLEIERLKFYENIVYLKELDIHVMMVFVNTTVFDTDARGNLITDVVNKAKGYSNIFGDLKFSGLPYIRAINMEKVRGELSLFVVLAMLVTALLLWLFFRSFKVVIVSLVVVAFGVIFSFGIIGLFDYKMSVLMGLIPPLIIVIGIPNCIYLINKYQQEYRSHGNKARALSRVIQKIGNATFMTNATTAMGFATFIFTPSELMQKFGIIASICIVTVFFLAIIIVPITLSFLKPPKEKEMKHLDRKWLYTVVDRLVVWSTDHRPKVYLVSLCVLILGGIGISMMRISGNIVDDLPKGDQVVQDLQFFEESFNGVMPFEVVIEAKNKQRLFSETVLSRVEAVQGHLKKETQLSRSVSVIDAIKFLNQAYYNGNPDKYEVPNIRGLQKVAQHVSNSGESTNLNTGFLNTDSTKFRVSMQVADIGTREMDTLLNRVKSDIDSILNPSRKLYYSALTKLGTIKGDEKDAFLREFYTVFPEVKSGIETELIEAEKDFQKTDILTEMIIKPELGTLEQFKIDKSLAQGITTDTSQVVRCGNNEHVNLFLDSLSKLGLSTLTYHGVVDSLIAVEVVDREIILQNINVLKGVRRNTFMDLYLVNHRESREVLLDKLSVISAEMEDEFYSNEDHIFSYHGNPGFLPIFKKGIEKNVLEFSVTGTSIVFTKGTSYLVNNLFISLVIAIVIIGILMATLFKSLRMVFVSLIPNLVPLIVTAAIMGFFNVPIKPSTILVFSVAFGISVDDTIHFLAKYRQELKNQKWNIKGSVVNAIRETGVSMIYTSIILFFGFGIFCSSNFGGTQALGILVSVTLLFAMLANLVLLPSLLLSLEKRITTKAFKEPLLELLDEEEDIDLASLVVPKT
ncbi:MAG: putative RND superfamily exporter protein [Parvicellaceae bacterium]|jgi:predicted RND superfamily exporter protein